MIVSYYRGGKICDYIAERWGESKLLDMIHAFAKNRPDRRGRSESSSESSPRRSTRISLPAIDKETASTVENFDDWTKKIEEVNKLAEKRQYRRSDREGGAVEGLYPDYVEAGNAYDCRRDACLKKGDKACARSRNTAVIRKEGGRDPDDHEAVRELLEEDGQAKEAEARAGAVELHLSARPELH